MGLCGSLLLRLTRSDRTVFSIDLIMTLLLEVNGDGARFKGLKAKTALMIRLDVSGRVLMRIDKQFSVASTTRASLRWLVMIFLYDTSCRR